MRARVRHEVFERQRIGNFIGVESLPLIPDYDRQPTAAFAAATDVDQLACVSAIAVEHRITQGFPKREFNELFLSANTARCCVSLISQSTSGEIWRSRSAPGVHSSGASVKRSLGSIDCSDLKLPTKSSLQHFQELFFGA